ncbi:MULTISPECIES: shikimate dehydrogenase [Micrococcaceae]|uniref:shikimate dehydrogenase n=1 Tax=Micrococcaceae TaxID=1268 RepID=UPI00161D088B|nr:MULTISPECIES: shikimate dehydrogenase [Micrococcaceae]MBB5748185.1 shikimate dehydrogenase [Micrococcus sp. TA1]HRO30609.1 shikimate dehydrogenase [Citricoccus sp.]HRO94432.1 shikimate dehydrogenase [Citricoccus sp.]
MSTVAESYLVGLIGDGITASLTPPMHEREGREQGLHYLYRPVDVAALGFTGDQAQRQAPLLLEYGRRLGFNAFNITHPFKQTIMAHLDEVDEDARNLGAVNTVVFADGRSVGHNTDFSGYITGLRTTLPEADLTSVVQLGVGGAGSAVAYALLRAGAEELVLIDLDADRAGARAADLQEQFPAQRVSARPHGELRQALARATGFAHCTPVGMHLHPGMPVAAEWLRAGMWVSDVVYLPVDTELIVTARDRGCAVVDGGTMAVGQAVDAFGLVTGRPADAGRMRRHFLDLVAAQSTGRGA